MIYAITAMIAGIPNIMLVSSSEDLRILIILTTSILVVSRYLGYFKLAGFALLDSQHIRAHSRGISLTLGIIIAVLLGNAAFFLYRFGLRDMSVTAISIGCIINAGVLISHLISSRESGITRSSLMRMVSSVLIVLGCTNICITRFIFISPIIGLVTLFFGIYTERKSLFLAIKQTVAVAGGSIGAGITIYFLRWYLDPSLLRHTALDPPTAIGLGFSLSLLGIGYYLYSRRIYASETAPGSQDHPKLQ